MIRRIQTIGELMSMALLLGSCAHARPSAPRAADIFQPAPAEREALVEALSGVLEELARPASKALAEGRSTVCVSVRSPSGAVEPDRAFLEEIRSSRPIVARSACPPRHDTGFLVVTRDGPASAPPKRPEGYIDPQDLEVAAQHYFLPDSARFDLQAHQGARIEFFVCSVFRTPAGWSCKCRHTGSAIF